MKKTFTFVVALFSLVLSLTAQQSLAAVFSNGSFEVGPDASSGVLPLYPGDTSIQYWEVVGVNSVDYIGEYWKASDGNRSIDVSGVGPGAIEQTFDTVPNEIYRVAFDIAGNPDNNSTWPSPSIKGLRATIDTGNHSLFKDFTFDATGQSLENMGWLAQEFLFTAENTTSTLRFTSLTEGAFGPALDNVNVSIVPLPMASVFMLSGLLGMAGFRKSLALRKQ
jgi:choice-of-anchor C domain-containing protein